MSREWTEEQKVRLVTEKRILKKELPHFWWEDQTNPNETKVKGEYISTEGNSYTICLCIGAGYPYEMPRMYIISPNPVIGYGGKKVHVGRKGFLWNSHAMHVNPPDWKDYVNICHWKPEYWSPQNTLLAVLMKGFLWVEALEVHRKTGKDICEYSLNFE